MMITRLTSSLWERYGGSTLIVFLAVQAIAGLIWGSKLDSQVAGISLRYVETDRRLAELDAGGSRGLALNNQRIATVDSQINHLSNMVMNNAKITAEVNILIVRLQGQQATLEAVLKRLDEQQTRIIQALDSTYNLVNEHMRASAHQLPPPPTGGAPASPRQWLFQPQP